MFSQIVNPKTNKKVSINSKAGKKILNNYINIQSGGKIEWNRGWAIAHGSSVGSRRRSSIEINILNALGIVYSGDWRRNGTHHYSQFWSDPYSRIMGFGIYESTRLGHIGSFRNMSLIESINDFSRKGYDPTYLINEFINIINSRITDSYQGTDRAAYTQARQRMVSKESVTTESLDLRDYRSLFVHNNLIYGLIQAFWHLTEITRHLGARKWINIIGGEAHQLSPQEAEVGTRSALHNIANPLEPAHGYKDTQAAVLRRSDTAESYIFNADGTEYDPDGPRNTSETYVSRQEIQDRMSRGLPMRGISFPTSHTGRR